MSGTTVEFELSGPTSGTAMIADDDSVWVAVEPRWWDLATWLWWFLCPSGRRAVVRLRVADGVGGATLVRTRAMCVAQRHIRVKNIGRGI
jgi:predicted AlkP superfamily pyrophosphatase or phosphodiesterase